MKRPGGARATACHAVPMRSAGRMLAMRPAVVWVVVLVVVALVVYLFLALAEGPG